MTYEELLSMLMGAFIGAMVLALVLVLGGCATYQPPGGDLWRTL